MRHFDEIFATASLHKGCDHVVEASLPKCLPGKKLAKQSDAFYLSNMCRRVFRAGLKHSLVDNKWPAFESVFHDFDPHYCAMLSDDAVDECLKNTNLIRHHRKLLSIRANAQFVISTAREYGSFGAYLAHWESAQTIDLWLDIKKKGQQLGGSSAPSFLRMVGKDTFMFTRDVVAVLMAESVIDRPPTAKRDLYAAQKAFLTWQEQCDRPLCEISRIVSFTASV